MDTICASLAFIDGLGAPEMVLIFVMVLVLFGGQKLPEFARGLGKTIREFKKAAAGVEEDFKRALEEDERKNVTPQIAPPPTPALAAAATTPVDAPGPEAAVHDYDEYGNEISPPAETETPAAPASPVTPPIPVPPESSKDPAAPISPAPTEDKPPAATPPAAAVTPPAPAPSPTPNPPPSGGHPESP